MSSLEKPPVIRLSVYQLILAAALSLISLIHSAELAIAIVAGALIQIIPNAYFAWQAFRFRGARYSQLIAQSFFRGEVGKYTMTLVGFATVFVIYPEVQVWAVFVSFVVLQITHALLSARLIAT